MDENEEAITQDLNIILKQIARESCSALPPFSVSHAKITMPTSVSVSCRFSQPSSPTLRRASRISRSSPRPTKTDSTSFLSRRWTLRPI